MRFRLNAETGISGQIVSGKHHSFAESRRTRGIIDEAHLVVVELGILDIFLAKPMRIGLFEVLLHIGKILHDVLTVALVETAVIFERDGASHLIDFLHLDMLPGKTSRKKQHRIGVVDDVMHVVGIEVLQDGHDNCSIGNRGKKGHHPARGITADEGYLVAAAYLAMAEQQMYAGYLARHIAIGKCLSGIVIGQCGQRPVFFKTLLVDFNEILVNHREPFIFPAKIENKY